MNKVFPNSDAAVADIPDGSTLMLGGFGLAGMPENLIRALVRRGVKGLHTISNNLGVDGVGSGVMLEAGMIDSHIGSYAGENKLLESMVLAGKLKLTLIPQGTLAERLRAGGCGIPAFFTPAGVGSQIADGGLPWRYAPDGTVAVASPAKEVREFGGVAHVLEEAIVTDFALVAAAKGDRHGNLVFDKSAQNFNPLCAMAGRVTIVEVEELVEPGEIDPAQVHLPGVFVQYVVHAPDVQKRIEKTTVTEPPEQAAR